MGNFIEQASATGWILWLAVALALFFIVTVYFLPAILTKKDNAAGEENKALDERRRTLVQIGGGAALILSFSWTFLKDSKSLEQAIQQNANQQFLASVQMLSDDKEPILMVSAIYSLDRIVAARREYHMPTRDTLAAMVRNRSGTRICDPKGPTADSNVALKTAVQVLGLRKVELDSANPELDLSDSNLIRASFLDSKNAFAKTNFIGSTLFGADFRKADLTGSKFAGVCAGDYQAVGLDAWKDGKTAKDPDWDAFDRYKYVVNFSGATLDGADFSDANLAGAIFADDLGEASFKSSKFYRTNLSRADFSKVKKRTPAEIKSQLQYACGGDPIKLANENWKVNECKGR